MNVLLGAIEVTTTFRYVLILEWLDKGDRRTGEELHAFLNGIGMPAKLVQCNSSDDVRRAITEARANIGRLGIPAVHLETHGEAPRKDDQNLQFGTQVAPGVEWFEFGDWLAPLNEASDF